MKGLAGLSAAVLALVTSLFTATLAAQDAQNIALLRGQTGVEPEPGTLLATPARLTVEQLPLADALAQLSERSSVQIAFSPSLLPPGHRVACACATLNIARALDQMLEGTELGYVELGTQVIVVPRAQPEIPRFDATIRGRVRTDVAFPLEDATAILRPASDPTDERMALTDGLGFFAFHNLADDDYVLTVGRIGYGAHNQQVTVTPGGVVEVGVALAEQAVPVEGIQVDGLSNRNRMRFGESAAGLPMEMDRARVRSMPGVVEADPVRTVDALPGVTRVSEIGASFNVRGGSADQNLVLLDGVPIFNPFHMLGIFSVFNADMVKRTELRSGGFAPEYGGRASSVLLVESDLGDGKFGVDGGLTLLTSRLSVSGGLPEEVRDGFGLASARWRISGRRSYADILANPFLHADFPYYLQDRQFGFEAWTKGGSRLRITSYSGRDAFNLTAWERLDRSDEWAEEELYPDQDVTWRWGNRALGFSWTRPGSGGGSLDIHGSYSRFEGDFNLSEFGSPVLETAIRRYSLGADMERRPTAKLRWKSGVALEYLHHSAVSRGEPESLVRSGSSGGLAASAYSQFNWSPNRHWLMEGGLRLDRWAESGINASPRIAVKRFLGDGRWAVRLTAGRYVQFLQSVRDESLPIALDSWVLAGDGASPVVSRQFQGGVEGFFGADDQWCASAVGYHRGYEGLAARNWADDPQVRSDDYLSGTGRSYGAEFLLRRSKGATTGWASISLLKATRKFPDTGGGLDPAPVTEYAPAFDRRLALDLVVQRRLPWSVDGGLRWSLGTGLPYTRHVSYSVNSRRIIDLRPGSRESVVWLGPKNGERFPVHHRLDISLRKVIRKRWGQMTPYLSVLNVYNRKNVVWYEYSHYHGQRRGLSLVPILPTFGVEVSF